MGVRTGDAVWEAGQADLQSVVAFDVLLERSGVEQRGRLWHEPGGRVVDCSVSRRANAAVAEAGELVPGAVNWPQVKQKRQCTTTKGRHAVKKTRRTGARTLGPWWFLQNMKKEGQDLCARCWKDSRGGKGGTRVVRDEQAFTRQRGGLQNNPFGDGLLEHIFCRQDIGQKKEKQCVAR